MRKPTVVYSKANVKTVFELKTEILLLLGTNRPRLAYLRGRQEMQGYFINGFSGFIFSPQSTQRFNTKSLRHKGAKRKVILNHKEHKEILGEVLVAAEHVLIVLILLI